MVRKVDLAREHPEYYSAGPEPEVVEIGEAQYLTIGGTGLPGSPEFQEKLRALYSLAYAVKSICKARGMDFVVPKLEGLWEIESGRPPSEALPEEWRWKLLIRMPDFVSREVVEEARSRVQGKGVEGAGEVRFERMREGRCVQVLHVGPYSAEGETLERLRRFAEERGLDLVGPHHEIYLSDPRRTPEDRLRTIVRYPVRARSRPSARS